MPERSLSAERSNYLRRFQRALSTVSDGVLRVRVEQGRPQTFAVGTGTGPGIRVHGLRGTHLGLRLNERFSVSNSGDGGPAWSAVTLGYQYQLHTDAGEEVLAFHWHPGRELQNLPHLHISAGAGTLRIELQRAHIPTGHISREDFLAFLIQDFDVRERRTDWKDVLTSSD